MKTSRGKLLVFLKCILYSTQKPKQPTHFQRLQFHHFALIIIKTFPNHLHFDLINMHETKAIFAAILWEDEFHFKKWGNVFFGFYLRQQNIPYMLSSAFSAQVRNDRNSRTKQSRKVLVGISLCSVSFTHVI